jgi:hypothetical protein
MQTPARTITLNLLTAAALVTAEGPLRRTSPCAEAGSCGSSPAEAAWMPDVATRRAELLARYEQFAAEPPRDSRSRADAQWWRGAASKPMPRQSR